MQVGDKVTLTDARGEHTGTVVMVSDTGLGTHMVRVKWPSGVEERVHESELKVVGIAADPPAKKTETLHETASGKVLTDDDIQALADEAEAGYELDDPKHPTFRERLSALWDSRPGK